MDNFQLKKHNIFYKSAISLAKIAGCLYKYLSLIIGYYYIIKKLNIKR